jgi:6-phosphofructokinase
MGGPVPGANNVVDGLLRFERSHKGISLIRFNKGLEGLISGDY